MRRYHADVQVTLKYHDAVYATDPIGAKELFRRAVENIFDELDPLIMDVEFHMLKEVPEPEDLLTQEAQEIGLVY